MYSSSALYNVILTSNVYYLEHFSSLLFSFFIKYIFRIGVSSVRNKKSSKAAVLQLKMRAKKGGNTGVLFFLMWLIIEESLSA